MRLDNCHGRAFVELLFQFLSFIGPTQKLLAKKQCLNCRQPSTAVTVTYLNSQSRLKFGTSQVINRLVKPTHSPNG